MTEVILPIPCPLILFFSHTIVPALKVSFKFAGKKPTRISRSLFFNTPRFLIALPIYDFFVEAILLKPASSIVTLPSSSAAVT